MDGGVTASYFYGELAPQVIDPSRRKEHQGRPNPAHHRCVQRLRPHPELGGGVQTCFRFPTQLARRWPRDLACAGKLDPRTRASEAPICLGKARRGSRRLPPSLPSIRQPGADRGRVASAPAKSPTRQSQPHCSFSRGAVAPPTWPLSASSGSARRAAGCRWGRRRTVAAPARRLPMQIGDRARGCASLAFGERRDRSRTGNPRAQAKATWLLLSGCSSDTPTGEIAAL